MNNNSVAEFYDEFAELQKDSGINDRIYSLFKQMKKRGLNTDSNVLELGCGVGTMTSLLTRVVKPAILRLLISALLLLRMQK